MMKAHIAFQVNARCTTLSDVPRYQTHATHIFHFVIVDVSLGILIGGIIHQQTANLREAPSTEYQIY